ncbi:MAG: hypothetical protein ABFS02_12940 [Pseudomonadota bacterium]
MKRVEEDNLKRAMYRRLIGFLVVVAVAPALWLSDEAGRNAWPGLHYDAVHYAPIVINYSAFRRLEYAVHIPQLMPPNAADRATGAVQAHGMLPYLFWRHAGANSFPKYFKAISRVNQFTIISMTLLAWLSTRRLTRLLRAIVVISSCWLTFSILLFLQGRPEHLVFPIIVLVELSALLCRGMPWLSISIRGIGLGLIGATSPASAIVYGSALVVYYNSRLPVIQLARVGLTLGIVSAAVWSLVSINVFDGALLDLIKRVIA